jgi:hypothetical protein
MLKLHHRNGKNPYSGKELFRVDKGGAIQFIPAKPISVLRQVHQLKMQIHS